MTNPDFIYPHENWEDCFVDAASRVAGQCKNLNECPEVLRKWQEENVYPKTCYFLQTEQFVCCPKTKQFNQDPIKEATTLRSLGSTTTGTWSQKLQKIQRRKLGKRNKFVVQLSGGLGVLSPMIASFESNASSSYFRYIIP